MNVSPARSLDLRRLPVLARQRIKEVALPERYATALSAIRECWRVDEVKDISDKHIAIAQYAKQIKDNDLLYYAERIRMRAFERIGELLSEIGDKASRKRVIEENRIGSLIAGRAMDAVKAPRKIRDALIEQTPPANTKRLADVGRTFDPSLRRWQTDGLRGYLEKERAIAPTPTDAAWDVFHSLRDVLDSINKRPLKDLGRFIDDSESAYVARVCEELIDAVQEFLDSVKAKQSAA